MSLTSKENYNLSTDKLHNRNSYDYLIQLLPYLTDTILSFLPRELYELSELENEYNEAIPYGDLYTLIISYLEEHIDSIYEELTIEETEEFDDFIYHIYHNDNGILTNQQNTQWIAELGAQVRPHQSSSSRQITNTLEDNSPAINQMTPKKNGNIVNRFLHIFDDNFKPQHFTNLPTVKHFSYKKEGPVEYRFPTQGQRHEGNPRVSPLFIRWLSIQAKRYPLKQFTHVYFNNLGLDRTNLDIARTKERALSNQLHKLEENPLLKIAVITLPANTSLLDKEHYKITNNKLSYAAVFKELFQVAKGEKHHSGVSDFKISPQIREELFGKNQNKIIKRLLYRSFRAMGVRPNQSISTAQKQAIWFHFIKYDLTNFILERLHPVSFNFACKDAIDRGAVSSIFYNLMQSFRTGNQPISREEFEIALHVAAANVKGRGMNFQHKILWNAIDVYVHAKYDELITDEKKSWLIFWRDMNCPKVRIKKLIVERLNETAKQLRHMTEFPDIQDIGRELFEQIKKQHIRELSKQNILLEVISHTSELINLISQNKISNEFIQSYKNLSAELQINYPVLYIIGGLLEALLGALLLIPSLGYSITLINQGYSLAKTGFFAEDRKELIECIDEFAEELQHMCPTL